MVLKWYCVEHHGKNEVGSYNEAEGITDFDRGTFLAYGDCCLVTGFATKEDAVAGLKKYPCKKGDECDST